MAKLRKIALILLLIAFYNTVPLINFRTMSTTLITVLIAILAVGLFVLGLSITLIRKGRNMESDVGSNREMRRRGIECASAQIRREEAERMGKKSYLAPGCDGTCGSCETTDDCTK